MASVPLAIAYVLALIDLARGPVGSALIWAGIGAVLMLAALGWTIYNRWLIGGRTGQSLGKRVLRLHLVGEQTVEPISPLNAFVRDRAHPRPGDRRRISLATVARQRKTFADMIMQTVVIDDRVPTDDDLGHCCAS